MYYSAKKTEISQITVMWHFLSLWLTFYSLFLSLSVSFPDLPPPLIHTYNTHISQYKTVRFYLFSPNLYIQNYSPWSILILSVFAWFLQWLLKEPRIKSELFPWPMWSDSCPIYSLIQTIFLHHSVPHMLISLLFLRHMRHDILSTWEKSDLSTFSV